MIKILIADDHAIVRRGLRDFLGREFEGLVCGEAANAEEMLARVQDEDWRLVILDLTMPGRNGFEVLRELKRTRPTLPVLVFSMHPETPFAKWALGAGASAYISKASAPEQLLEAMRRILAGVPTC